MQYLKATSFLLMGIFLSCNKNPKSVEQTTIHSIEIKEKPTVSFTFDDGLINDIATYKFEDWNQYILNTLEEENIKAFFFLATHNKRGKKGKYLIKTWDDQNHKIANHTLTHPNFHDKNNTIEDFEDELLLCDAQINQYKNFVKFFRFPYLKEGKSREKIDGIRAVMKKHGYRNGYVTIDASDWFVNSRLINQMNYRKVVDTIAFQNYYLDHIMDRAKFYDDLAFNIHGRRIKHTLLLHHNLTSALFLKSLIQRFKEEGWEIIDAAEAYQDPVYQMIPNTVPAGESLIWSQAKESGLHEDRLRYPAEDGSYEKEKMEALGL